QQGIAIFFGPVAKMNDEVLHLFAGGFAQCLGATEVGGIGLYEVSVELMLPDELTEPVANPRAIAVAAVPVYRLSVNVLDFGFRVARCPERSVQRSDFFHRADANPVGFAQSTIDGAGLGHPHFGTANERRDI